MLLVLAGAAGLSPASAGFQIHSRAPSLPATCRYLRSCNFRKCAVRFGLIGKFEVFFDDPSLFRPIQFKGLPATNKALKSPLAFIGNHPVTQNPARSATNAGAASINLVCRISFATLFGAS
jgi:hypothetical protein